MREAMSPPTARSPRPRAPRTIAAIARGGPAALLALAFAALAGACSVLVEDQTDQCAIDADCEEFGNHPYCIDGICVESGLGPPGCFLGEPATNEQFQNQCTSSQCEPFDNCTRLGLCSGSQLPPLVPPP
jgi:hypothetical protein